MTDEHVPYSEYNDGLLMFWIEQAARVGDRKGEAMFRQALAARRRLTSVPADRLGAPPQTERDDTAAAELNR